MTITKEELDKAVKDAVAAAVAETNAKRDEAEKGLKANFEAVLKEKKAAADKAKEEAVKAAEAEAARARKEGDFEAMDKSWAEKFAALEAEKSEAIASRDSAIGKLTSGQTVSALAAELAVKGSESALAKLIAPRIGFDISDGDAKSVVLDENGKPTALTIDEFKKQVLADAAIAPLLAGTQGTGGGAANPDGGAGVKTITQSEFLAMSPKDRAAAFAGGAKFEQ